MTRPSAGRKQSQRGRLGFASTNGGGGSSGSAWSLEWSWDALGVTNAVYSTLFAVNTNNGAEITPTFFGSGVTLEAVAGSGIRSTNTNVVTWTLGRTGGFPVNDGRLWAAVAYWGAGGASGTQLGVGFQRNQTDNNFFTRHYRGSFNTMLVESFDGGFTALPGFNTGGTITVTSLITDGVGAIGRFQTTSDPPITGAAPFLFNRAGGGGERDVSFDADSYLHVIQNGSTHYLTAVEVWVGSVS